MKLLPVVDRLDEPLTAGDDLERPVALLVELDVVRDRLRLADAGRRSRAAARRSSTCAFVAESPAS